LLLVDQVINARYPLDNDEQGRDMGITMTVCDSGGAEGTTENAYRFWKYVKKLGLHNRFNLIKGLRPKRTANTPLVHKTILDRSSKSARRAKVTGEQPLWMINTTQYKDMVMANLSSSDFGAGYIHFPNHLSMAFYSEVVAETRTDAGWDNLSRRKNEAFDLLGYSRAAVKIKLINHWQNEINWEAPPPWADVWDRNSEVSNPDDRLEKETNVPKKVERTVRMRSKGARRGRY
jgi:phage terminase large subunit GpA-like protein